MIILGIDPGTADTGYGLIEVIGNSKKLLDYGCINTAAGFPLPLRLEKIHYAVQALIEKWRPDEAAVEQLFFSQNIKTALTVAQARGVVLLACEQKKLLLGEYTPLQVKQAVVGYGHADKKQIQYMVARFLQLESAPKPDDAADALAIAICHAHFCQNRSLRGESR
ncbi:MAG: crossover junction endodeoxyribonuclease RuvC [Clostridiales bacterium]|nr:crossover junction endodeoxyribonuclease RuvC [Clostridiales bacterium]